MLLESPREVVTREQLRNKLWPSDTFVDFDHGLNNAVNRLREALCDSADSPRFIETLPRRGYRLIVPVVDECAAPADPVPAADQRDASKSRTLLVTFALGLGILAAISVAAFAFNIGGLRAWLPARTSRPQIRSIAVLPLENLTGDPSENYFADGMTDALITDLAQIGTLRVISRTSSMQYKSTRKPLPQIARELNVDAVVEGTVVRSGDHVRIDAQLIRAETDQHLWAKSYEGNLNQIIALQGDVAAAISNEVRAKLTSEERARLTSQHPIDPEAYELYLRGNYFLETRTREGMEKALQYYQEAAQKDPSSAQAFAGLADAYSLLYGFGFLADKEAVPAGTAAAEKAVSLNGSSAEALTALAGFTDDPAREENFFRRAMEVNPGYALAHHWYARFLSEEGRFDEALVEISKARSLDPLSLRIIVNEGEILFAAGQRDKAIEQFRVALDMDPNFPVTRWALGRSLFYAGQYDSSLSHLHKAVELNPYYPPYRRWLAIVCEFLKKYPEAIAEFQKTELLNGMHPAEASARAAALRKAFSTSGERGYWREWIALRMKDREKSPHLYAYNIAYDYAHLGENAKALDWLETCLQEKGCTPLEVSTDPGLDGLRSNLRFQSLLARMKLPPNRAF